MTSRTASRGRLVEYSLQQIAVALRNEEYARCLAHFCVVFRLEPVLKRGMKDEFLLATARHTAYLESREMWKELFDCYQELLNVNEECEELHHWMGTLLFRLGQTAEATTCVRRALDLNPEYSAARASLEGIKTSILERWHFPMLNDSNRNKAFQEAITSAVVQGHHQHVLDIGAGTGLLSLFAAGAGAQKVYACEVSAVSCDVARAVFELNKVKAKVINKHSTDLKIPEDMEQRASLVVTETFDAGLLGEHVLPNLLHAWDNLLDFNHPTRPKVIPELAEVFVCLLECEHARFQTSVKGEIREALGIGEMRQSCAPYTTLRLKRVPRGYRKLSLPLHLLSVNFNNPEEMRNLQGQSWSESLECSETGTLDCLALWFRLQVGDSWLDTMEGETCWEQAIYPVSSRSIKKGESVQFSIQCDDHISIAVMSPPVPAIAQLELQDDVISILNESFSTLSLVAENASLPSGARILDISTVPILGLLILRKDKTCHLTTLEGHAPGLIAAFLKKHGTRNNHEATTINSLIDHKVPAFDALMTDVWDGSGNMRTSLLENVTILRSRVLKKNGLILPETCSVWAVLIESPALEVESRIVSEDCTLGWQVASCLNNWAQVSSHQDICLSTIPHRALCAPFKLFSVALSDTQGAVTAKQIVHILRTGFISACAYWFQANYIGGHTDTNYGQECHLHQAAIVFPERINVECRQSVTVDASGEGGRINIRLKLQ